MGTGTIGVSALKLNRRFIGVDIDESYYVTAMDRLHKTMSGLKQHTELKNDDFVSMIS